MLLRTGSSNDEACIIIVQKLQFEIQFNIINANKKIRITDFISKNQYENKTH